MEVPPNDPNRVISPTGLDYMPAQAFYVLNWVFFALCTVAFAIRAYIRWICFRKLLLEDYIMLVALVIHNAEAVVIQLFVGYAYDLERVEHGDFSVYSPNFFENSRTGLVGLGTCVNLSIVGILLVKLNFLLFFRRLGASLRFFTLLWWFVLLFTVGGAAAQIGMQSFGCFFGPVDYIFGEACTSVEGARHNFFNAIFSATADAVSDFLIIGFPVAILWKSRIGFRKKVALTFIFSLVFLTIAITIVRGAVFHDIYSDTGATEGVNQSVTFTWFWFYCEFTVAFLIACIVSFRTLFVHRERKTSNDNQKQQQMEAAYQSAVRRGWRMRARRMHDTFVETCKSMEGWTGDEAETLGLRSLPSTASGLMTVDFNDDENWTRNVGKSQPGAEASLERSVSVQSLLQPVNTTTNQMIDEAVGDELEEDYEE